MATPSSSSSSPLHGHAEDNENDSSSSCSSSSHSHVDDYYAHLIESIRSDTGLEIGVRIHWPSLSQPLQLSTCLDASQIAPIFHGTQWAGTRVWTAAMVALNYLLLSPTNENETTQQQQQITSETRILELGAGLGVPSMILHAVKECSVVVTDREALLKQLQDNLQANQHLFPSGSSSNSNSNSSIQALPLDWSRQGVADLLATLQSTDDTNTILPFDIILNCDCIFEPLYGTTSWKQLIECQEALLEAFPNTIMLTVCERRNHDGIDKYLQALNESNIVARVEAIQAESCLGEEYPNQVELYRLYSRLSK